MTMKYHNSLGHSFVLLMFITTSVAAQSVGLQRQKAREYAKKHYQTDFWDVDNSELLQGTIQAITQSKDGFLWLATQGGLARFDGIDFEMYHTQRFPEIRNDFLTDVKVSADSTIWCATFGGGIFGLKNGKLHGISTEQGLSSGWMQNLVVTSRWGVWYRSLARIGQILDTMVVENWGLAGSQMRLYGEHYGSLWAGTQEGLLRFDNGTWDPVSFGSADFGLAYDLFIDSTGRFWIASEQGLYSGYEFDLTRHDRLRMSIRDVSLDSQGRVWVCTFEKGLYCLDGRKLSHYDRSDGLGSNNVHWTFEDRQGTIWVCDDAGGLSLIDKEGIFIPQVDEFLFGRAHVRTIFEDQEGNLWIGTFAGLARVKQRRVRMLTVDDGLQAPLVWTMAEAKNGDVYLGTNKGIALVRNGRVSSVLSLASLPQVPITALSFDSDGVLWIGTLGEGLWSMDRNGVSKRFPAQGRHAPRIIRSVDEVGKDSLLLGTSQSTLMVDVRSPAVSVLEYDTSDGQMLTTHRDRLGRLWMGMENGVIKEFRLDGAGQRWTLPVDPDRYPVSWIVTSEDGTFWCSTLGGGLVKIHEGVTHVFDAAENHLPNSKFNWVKLDRRGRLWIGTNKGVASIPVEVLENGPADGSQTRLFGTSDGLISTETMAWSQSPALLREDGTLWFGTLKGVGIIDVQNVGKNEVPPPVTVDRIVVNTELYSASGPLVLSPGNNDLEFHYTAASLVASERNQYRYRLEGYDAAWIEAKSRRIAYYTNVPPGTYRFLVRASNNDGLWSRQTAVATIVLEPHFYQTVWFLALCIVAVFGLGVGAQKLVWRYRNEKELAESLQMRLEASQLRALRMQLHPHFLFNTLNAISSMILKKPRQAVTMVGKLSEMLRLSLEKEQIQFTTLQEEMEFLNKYLSFEQVRFGNRLSVSVHFEEGIEGALVPTFLLQPLVENAIKHGFGNREDQGTVTVDAVRSNGHLQIQVRDNGHGVAGSEPVREGVGLSNTRTRLKQLYGERFALVLSNEPDRGFVVTIALPLEFERSAE